MRSTSSKPDLNDRVKVDGITVTFVHTRFLIGNSGRDKLLQSANDEQTRPILSMNETWNLLDKASITCLSLNESDL